MKVLIVDDEPFNVDLLEQELAELKIETIAARDGRAAIAAARDSEPDLILLDVAMPGMDGFEVCEKLKAEQSTRDVPVLFMTALAETRDKVRGFQAGAIDYITKPFQAEELMARVQTHLELRRARQSLERQNRELREAIEAHERARETIGHLVDEIDANFNGHEIVGESGALKALLDSIHLVAPTDSTVLIQGETGTGKELIARATHAHSRRRARPLVKVNCAALPRELVESELFGHEKGAFTGATGQRKGRFELADGGTIFLDEIGELPLESQAKLLRVLQDQEVERVGGSSPVRTDARVIAATNRDLDTEVAAGRFRSDLFYRLNVFPLPVPPLRQRREDIPVLARHFMEQAARSLGKDFASLSPAFLQEALDHDWPGNIRELENAVMRAAIRCPGPVLELAGHLVPAAHTAVPYAPTEDQPPVPLETVERAHIHRALEHTGWVIEGTHGAAALLGLNPSTLRGRLRKLGIRKTSRAPDRPI